jgi:hypothetical protein
MMFLSPSERLAVASLVPLGVIALMWFLSRRTLARYEACTDSTDLGGGPHLLQKTRFWSSTRRTVRLQRIHIAAAVATLMAYVGIQVGQLTGDPNVWTFVAVAILVVCFVATARLHPQDLEYTKPQIDSKGPYDKWAPWLMRLSVLLVLTQLVWLAWPSVADRSRTWDSTIGWWGHNLWFIGLFVALSAVNIAVFAAGRMHRVPATMTIVVFATGVGIAAWRSLQGEDIKDDRDLAVILALSFGFAFAFFGAMLVWQLSQKRVPALADKAWYGGAPAVMIGAAGWIALLFTTAAVTAAAEYLNGPDQTVSDLTSVSTAVEEATAPDEVTNDDTDPVVVDLSEDAVLRDGIVVLGAGGAPPMLVRGTLEVDTAEYLDPKRDEIRRLADTVIFKGLLRMEDPTLLLVDTCKVEGGGVQPPACHPEDPTFVSAVKETVDGQLLMVNDEGRVRLSVAEPPATPLVVPQVLIWAPVVQVLWALLAGLIALGCYVQLKARTYARIKRLVDKEGVATESRNDIRSKRLRAAYAHRAERLIELLGGVTVVCVLLLLCLSATGLPPNTLVSKLFPELRSDLPHLLASLSLYVVLALSAGFVLLSSYVRRSEATRKAVGILWDLTTFWPRAAHPLSPPCYAERVVPELTTRIRWALERHGTVVVSGHSQGSLIAAATLIRLEEEELERVTLVTYGSQLRALYGRIFPRVLGPAVLGNQPTVGSPTFKDPMPDAPRVLATAEVAPPGHDPKTLWDCLGKDGWFNLFRRGDPLGWRVFSDEDSDHDVPTPEVPPREAGDPGPTVSTHSGYQHTIEYRRGVCAWLGEALVEDSDWDIGEVQPLPEP